MLNGDILDPACPQQLAYLNIFGSIYKYLVLLPPFQRTYPA